MIRKDCEPPAEKLLPAKNGYTVRAGEISLHSGYDPVLEAEKYVAAFRPEKPYQCFILIEPALGYLVPALKKRFPEAALVILHCSAFYSDENFRRLLPVTERERLMDKTPCWDPSCNESLENFLERNIIATDASKIRLIEWKPSVNAYGRACADLAARTVEYIRRMSAGRNTVRNFGRRWLRNALRNTALLKKPVEFRPGTEPVLICAAGPGLEDLLPAIAEWKQGPEPPLIIAVSSAAPALLHRKITPDIIITTDGGPWALFHLFECFRSFEQCTQSTPPVLAAALTAALPSQAENVPVLFLGDGSLWQELLLRSFHFPFISFPQRGTVSASALDLALHLTEGTIYFAGLDFSHRDLKTHARPYAFEKIPENTSSRYAPFYSQTFERAENISSSGSLGIYAAWFKTHLDEIPKRLYTLGSSTPGLPRAIPQLRGNGAMESGKGTISFTVHNGFNPPDKEKGIALLLDALSSPLTAKQAEQELGELLFPDGSEQGDDLSVLLEKELKGIVHG